MKQYKTRQAFLISLSVVWLWPVHPMVLFNLLNSRSSSGIYITSIWLFDSHRNWNTLCINWNSYMTEHCPRTKQILKPHITPYNPCRNLQWCIKYNKQDLVSWKETGVQATVKDSKYNKQKQAWDNMLVRYPFKAEIIKSLKIQAYKHLYLGL